MHVLGDLLTLDKDSEILNIPWWHRAPLGLIHDTPVYVSLVEGTARPVGELVVSVIDPDKKRVQVDCRREDRPGVLSSALQLIQADRTNVNVALAEAVTIESGNLHHVSLVCEMPDGSSGAFASSFKRKLKADGFRDIQVTQYHPLAKNVWSRKGRVSHGGVVGPRHMRGTDTVTNSKEIGVQWRAALLERYAKAFEIDYDLNKVVVTADLDNRILRYVFPRRGALTVKIRHADKPGTLQLLSQALGKCNLNILSALLRRGGNESGDATFLAVCEPIAKQEYSQTKEMIEDACGEIAPQYRVDPEVSEGRDSHNTIYGRHPDEIVARVPESLRPMVLAARDELPRRLTPVFLSRRFNHSGNYRATKIVEHVKKVLGSHDCHAVEALPAPGHDGPAPFQVSSKLWASTAAVVLVMNIGEHTAFSMNLAHEYGFMQGQGKPIIVLVERGQEKALEPLSNIQGINVAYFASDDLAFSDMSQSESISTKLGQWIGSFNVKRRGGRGERKE
jgi:ACT domain-containing protein